jgi:hypothetical protein
MADKDISLTSTVLVAAGRLMIDVWSYLGAQQFSAGDWVGELGEIRVEVGGPVHVCDGFLRAGGAEARLVSALGGSRTAHSLEADPLGSFAIDRLRGKNIVPECMIVESTQTGRVMLLYPSGGGRLMVSDITTAPRVSGEYIVAAVDRALDDYERCLVYVDGYLYFDPLCPDVADLLTTRPEGARLWVDVLPHTLYRDMTFRDLLKSIETVDLVSIDGETVQGFAQASSMAADVALGKMLCECDAVAVVGDDGVDFHDHRGHQRFLFPGSSVHEWPEGPGTTDKIVSEIVTRAYLNRLGSAGRIGV